MYRCGSGSIVSSGKRTQAAVTATASPTAGSRRRIGDVLVTGENPRSTSTRPCNASGSSWGMAVSGGGSRSICQRCSGATVSLSSRGSIESPERITISTARVDQSDASATAYCTRTGTAATSARTMPRKRQPSGSRANVHHSLPGDWMPCQSTVRTGLVGSVEGCGTIILVAHIPSDRHLHLSILDRYRVGAHAQSRRGEALAGGDVELDAMPGAGDDLTLAHPRELPVRRDGAGHRAVDRPRAKGTKLMRTDIREGVKLAVYVEDTDLDPSQRDYAMRPRRKLLYSPHDILSHLRS